MAGNELTRGRFGDALRDFLGLSSSSPAPELGTQILPTVLVNDQVDPTLAYLRTERLCAGGATLAPAGAGNYNYIGLLNPSTSQTLAVIEQVAHYSSAAVHSVYWLTIPAGIGPGSLSPFRANRDYRWGTTRPLCTVNQTSPAVDPSGIASGVMFRDLSTAVSPPFFRRINLVLRPGDQLWLGQGLVSVADFYASFIWRERAFGPEEVARL